MHERQSTLDTDRQPLEVEEAPVPTDVESDAPHSDLENAVAPAADARESGNGSMVTRILAVVVLIVGAGVAGFGASLVWPLPSRWIWTPPAWSVPPQEAKTYSRRTRPRFVMPEGPVKAALSAPSAFNSSQARVLGQTTLNEPVTTERGPSVTETSEAKTVEATASNDRKSPSDVTPQHDVVAQQKRSWRATREQPRSRGGGPQLADSLPSGARPDSVIRSFMATPNNF